jgi:hypothetical protein
MEKDLKLNGAREEDAKLLLKNDLFVEAFKVLRENLTGQWNGSAVQDVAARESIWLALRLLDRIEIHISSIIETGEMARIMEKQHPYI